MGCLQLREPALYENQPVYKRVPVYTTQPKYETQYQCPADHSLQNRKCVHPLPTPTPTPDPTPAEDCPAGQYKPPLEDNPRMILIKRDYVLMTLEM